MPTSRRWLGLAGVPGRAAAAITVPGVKSSDRKPLSWASSGWRRLLIEVRRAWAAWRALESASGSLIAFSAAEACFWSRATSFWMLVWLALAWARASASRKAR